MATVICRRASFLAERPRRPRAWARALLCGLFACAAEAGAAELELELGRLEHAAFVAEGVRVSVGEEGASAQVFVASLTAGGHRWEQLRLRCRRFSLADGVLQCLEGTLASPGDEGPLAVDLDFNPAAKSARVHARTESGESIRMSMAPTGALRAEFEAVAASRLADWFPALTAWQPVGKFSGQIDYRPAAGRSRIAIVGQLRNASFGSADGLQAAEGLELDVELQVTSARPTGWNWDGRLAWRQGEAYLHPLYLTAGATIAASGGFADRRLELGRASLSMDGVRTVEANGEFDLDAMRILRGAVTVAEADLERVGPVILAPLLAPARAQSLTFYGHASAGMLIEDGRIVAIDLAFDEAGFSMDEEALGFGPLSGYLPWREAAPTRAALSIGGGYWQKLSLGAFELDARVLGRAVEIDRVAVPVLDGELILSDLALRRDDTGWWGSGAAVIEPISMSLLSAAVGLPPMSGDLSASLPGLHVRPGEIALDGVLQVTVFDGTLHASNLQWLEPLSVASHLYGDFEARGLDLAKLTEAFSFGSISGLIDADVRGLELANWRPLRFDAHVRSSPGRYPRRISQRAVQNISALGGPGAAMAIQRGFLGLFDTFGYSRIGLSCVLSDGVCTMGGVGSDAASGPNDGFVIIKGGGIPALNVIGYNRRVDWNELLDRLQRVVATNVSPVIE